MKIAVRGGHTKISSGAVAVLNELIEDRKVKDSLVKYLKQLGHTVLDVTPSDNTRYPAELNYGIKKANDWGADLFVSVHFNKCYDSYNGAIGTEVCVFRKNDTAQRVVNKLASLGFTNRGQKIRNDLGELTKTKMPSMIVEVCFVEATKDVELYKKAGFDTVGKVIAEGISNKNITSTPPVKPPTSGAKYRVVAGWFETKEFALTQQRGLKVAGFDSFLLAHTNGSKVGYRVVAGTYSSKANAESQQKQLKKKGFDSFLAAI